MCGQNVRLSPFVIGAENLSQKVALDVANALDFSHGFPPALGIAGTDSLAEQIQRAFPTARVVKALNTTSNPVMINPGRVPGDHIVFLSGDDADGKATVSGILHQFGWRPGNILDLGALSTARSVEGVLPLWLSVMQKRGNGDVNFGITTP